MEAKRGSDSELSKSTVRLYIISTVSSPPFLCDVLGYTEVLSQQKLQELVKEVDPKQVLDEDVEDVSS